MTISVQDAFEIDQLVCRYNFAFDRRDAEAFAECFTTGGEFLLLGQGQARGREALVAYVRELTAPGQLRHLVTSLLMEGSGDTASSQAYCTVYSSRTGGGISVIAQGVYRDELKKESGVWLFSKRDFAPDPT